MSTGYGNRIDFAQPAEPIILNGDLTNDLLPGGQARFEVFPCKQAAAGSKLPAIGRAH